MTKKITNHIKLFSKGDSDESELLLEFKKEYLDSSRFIRDLVYWNVRSTDTDDIIQETYLKAWRAFPTFNRKSKFKSWVYRIAMNCIHDHFRAQKKIRDYVLTNEGSSVREDQVELKDLITKALLNLNEQQREVFVLYYKFSYTQEEISSLINLAEGTVKSRLYKAKEVFENYIDKNGGR